MIHFVFFLTIALFQKKKKCSSNVQGSGVLPTSRFSLADFMPVRDTHFSVEDFQGGKLMVAQGTGGSLFGGMTGGGGQGSGSTQVSTFFSGLLKGGGAGLLGGGGGGGSGDSGLLGGGGGGGGSDSSACTAYHLVSFGKPRHQNDIYKTLTWPGICPRYD